MKIDIHTHHPKKESAFKENPKEISVYCHANYREEIPEHHGPLCLGLHPWYLPENEQEEREAFEFLSQKMRTHQIFALGECGLDRLKGPSMGVQERFLKKQLMLAQELEIQIMIFHCVRAYPEIQKVLKESVYNGPVIFHDYGANAQITGQLLANPQIYFSLGRALDRGSFCQNVLPLLPKDKIFLETDDDTVTIDQRYQQLAKLLPLSSEEIENLLAENFDKLQKKERP